MRQKVHEYRPVMRNFIEIHNVISDMKYAGGRMERPDLLVTYITCIFCKLFHGAASMYSIQRQILG
jgi:hypothetical protein